MKAMKVRRRFETRGHRVELHVLPPNDPALLEMRTIYPSTVRSASANTFVLKSGENSTKLGNKITKSRFGKFCFRGKELSWSSA